MRSVKNCVELIIILIVLGAATYSQRDVIWNWINGQTTPELPPAVEYQEVKEIKQPEDAEEVEEVVIETETQEAEEAKEVEEPPAVMATDPVSFNLAVPFTPQAPYGDWGAPYKESCEEASLYMVHAYYQGIGGGSIPPETAKEDLLKLVDFENELFGYYEDTTAEQTGMIAEMFYGYETVETVENPTVEQIKRFVASGLPVIIPVAGREIGNPFFTAPGPIYHMLVIRGYTQDGRFITNDPGTKHGEAYLYDFDTLMSAMHDWNGGADIKEGKKVILVIHPN